MSKSRNNLLTEKGKTLGKFLLSGKRLGKVLLLTLGSKKKKH